MRTHITDFACTPVQGFLPAIPGLKEKCHDSGFLCGGVQSPCYRSNTTDDWPIQPLSPFEFWALKRASYTSIRQGIRVAYVLLKVAILSHGLRVKYSCTFDFLRNRSSSDEEVDARAED